MYYELTEIQKVNLVDIIIENESYYLGYLEFTVVIAEITENIAGMELLSQKEYDDLILELWDIFETKRNKEFSQLSRMIEDM